MKTREDDTLEHGMNLIQRANEEDAYFYLIKLCTVLNSGQIEIFSDKIIYFDWALTADFVYEFFLVRNSQKSSWLVKKLDIFWQPKYLAQL